MGIFDNFKEVADLVKKIGDVELYRKMVELEGEVIELTRQNRAQEEEIGQLRNLVSTKQRMVFRKPFYYMEGDEHPYCSKCWEVDNVSVHLRGPIKVAAGPGYECPNCKTFVIDR